MLDGLVVNDNRYRIFIIGAGFSVHAGLPLGTDLLELVRERIRYRLGNENKLESDLSWYLSYRRRCEFITADVPVDYEKFMSFLDMEHYLGLKGGDTWSEEGNESQLMIRNGIMEVIHSRQPDIPTDECIRFCQSLSPSDTILTFNYDTLIEDTLDHLGIRYRLFPNRLKKVGLMSSTIDSKAEEGEIVILKLHGSIDWFNKVPYIKDRKLAAQHEIPWESKHPIFKQGSTIEHHQLTQGPREADDPLQYIYRVNDLNQIIGAKFWQCCPLILSPSSSKILYADPIKGLWRGIQKAGGLNFGLGVIGYSLPPYDEYAKQALYHLIRNYTEFEPNLELGGLRKSPIRILDYVPSGESDWRIRRNYSFINWERCELMTTGLSLEGVEWIME
ncbi:SIR2 family protein [Nitrosococcus wardiae]|uniref:Uncharacterized protein n=1 Tax=Nitrosococcus wardiae TaxID=1814290 RepID=A0A4P7BU41_9GAMM|nr:SIR2 family protein [Nitrosococcus wardiae]QBQ53381.1 hypothetical protein E3U44_01815 [Nitrosococcus wardiae]